jgi:very-short-patch-repair endonuclease
MIVKQALRNVLEYTEHMLATRVKVISDVDNNNESVARFHESDIAGLEGVDVNVAEDTWLRVHRIREIKPPLPDSMLDGWVDFGSHPSPDKAPTLKGERVVRLSIEDISDLFEAEILTDGDDVLTPDSSDGGVNDIVLHTANMPEFCAMWRAYVDGPWAAWAVVERSRRKSIRVYNDLYQIHQRMMSLGEDTPVEMVFGLGVARWRTGGQRINIPLIEKPVELDMDEAGIISVRPRRFLPKLVMAAFQHHQITGSEAVQHEIGDRFARMADDPDVGFSPFEKSTFESVLRSCSTRLSETGIYRPDETADRTLPPFSDVLRVTDTWVLYARQRAEDGRRSDIRRLIQGINDIPDEKDLPPAAVRFVVAPSDRIADDNVDIFDPTSRTLVIPDAPHVTSAETGSSNRRGRTDTRNETLFFPLPYNDEQQEIIKRLEAPNADGVVVQGPPGTGKTHTIANIVCHFMATGRRVLVTAKTPEALTALQEKIPADIRDLAIAVVHNDREGARQLDHAVRILADRVNAINPRQVSGDVKEKQSRIAEIRNEIEEIDRRLQSIAQRNLAKFRFRGNEIKSIDLAKVVAEERDRHAWFPDVSSDSDMRDPGFTDAEIAEIRDLRRRLAGDLAYAAETLPITTDLPALASVIAAHGELAHIGKIEGRENIGDLPFMVLDDNVRIEHARQTLGWLRDFNLFMEETRAEPWAFDVYQILLGVKPIETHLQARLRQEVSVWFDLHREGTRFLVHAIRLDHLPIDDPALDKALDDYCAGRSPFGVFSMFRGGLKTILDQIEIEGRKPATPEDWSIIREYRAWQRETSRFIGRWTGVANVAGLPSPPADRTTGHAQFMRMGRLVGKAHQFYASGADYRRMLEVLFPYGININDAVLHGKCALVIDVLAANVERAESGSARVVVENLRRIAGDRPLPFHKALSTFYDNLGSSAAQADIARAWQAITAEAARLAGLRGDIERLDALCSSVAASGALRWAEALRTAPDEIDQIDTWTPANWRDTWEWAQADRFLRSLGDRQKVRFLTERRAAAETEQRRLFAEVIVLRTFLGLKPRLSEKVKSALAKFTAAIARLGQGTGQGAARQRRIIQEATQDTAHAVPCWILPEWRVAEQLPSELGVFDLVVVDEASQSDITAFPIILRGRKILIVGDDQQVSPTVIGIDGQQVARLRKTFLSGLPFADQMDPATSLYELCGVVFPSSAIMLREHFRCVEPIIRFSSQFYARPLLPLRLPTASERFDPPLLDIYVPSGRRDGDINAAEADVIVSEIARLIGDEGFANRSIGVISLIGATQSAMIYNRLVAELGTEIIERHRIMCGNAATFQGQERDIIFLSMVACPTNVIAQTARNIAQRFNVAASRARDRLVLVRSVAASHLKPDDLKLKLIEHFRNPMEVGNIVPPSDVLDLCQSGFERDVGRRLLDQGFRLRPQVPVAGYSIDFVVEGAGDRRLAIELDGDNFHGPERWADDIRRQKILERLGWTFWRCWGSSWYADPDGCMTDLLDTMKHMGIEPLGMASVTAVHTEHITISSPTASSFEASEATIPPEEPATEATSDGSHEPEPSDSRQRRQKAGSRRVQTDEDTTTAASRNDGDDFILTAPAAIEIPRQQPLPLNGFMRPNAERPYIQAEFSGTGIELEPDRLHDAEYRLTLRQLVAHIITVEGPIYGDILAVRIARAHSRDRTGNAIKQLVLDSVETHFPRTREDDRDLFWPQDARTDAPFPYRPSIEGVRSHADTPLAELASIALPHLRVSLSEEEILQKMAEHLRLGRLHRATRERFEAALRIAKRSL